MTGVIDGDTIRVRCPQFSGSVRFAGVNAPESKQTYDKQGRPYGPECYGAEATDYVASRLTYGGPLTIESNAGAKDAQGRLLGYVLLPSGENLNVTLVALGYAQTTLGYWATWEPWNTQLREAEADAYAQRLGAWTCPKKAHNSAPTVGG